MCSLFTLSKKCYRIMNAVPVWCGAEETRRGKHVTISAGKYAHVLTLGELKALEDPRLLAEVQALIELKRKKRTIDLNVPLDSSKLSAAGIKRLVKGLAEFSRTPKITPVPIRYDRFLDEVQMKDLLSRAKLSRHEFCVVSHHFGFAADVALTIETIADESHNPFAHIQNLLTDAMRKIKAAFDVILVAEAMAEAAKKAAEKATAEAAASELVSQ